MKPAITFLESKERICTRCKIKKSFNEYSKCSSNKFGIKPSCKTCQKNEGKEYRQKNSEKIREKAKKKYIPSSNPNAYKFWNKGTINKIELEKADGRKWKNNKLSKFEFKI